MGDTGRCGVPEPRELDDEVPSLDPCSEVDEDCELFFLGR